ncbi:MAG: hypothetical protein LC791_06165, partial [Acidobacteria bacterium]|nr:hypothetical protein [Acidobacteriota bacterium]
MFLRDLRFQLRMWLRQPLFAAVAIGTLALGVGANVAMFSVVRAVLLRPLPYPDGDRLVQIRSFDGGEGTVGNLSPADFLDFERDTMTFAGMGAHLEALAGRLEQQYPADNTDLGVLVSPRSEDVRIDGNVLAFTVLVALVSSILIGLIPALQVAPADLHETLKDGGRQPSSGVRRGAREALIAAEVALSIVLLVAAGLLLRSLANLYRVDPGFSAEQVLALDVSLPTAHYEEGTQIPFYARLLTRVRHLPGVREAGAINILPLSANYDSRGVQIDRSPAPVGQA